MLIFAHRLATCYYIHAQKERASERLHIVKLLSKLNLLRCQTYFFSSIDPFTNPSLLIRTNN